MRLCKILGLLVGCVVNMIIVFVAYSIYQTDLNIMIASFAAYPFASLAKKYSYLGFRKLYENH